MLTVNNFPVSTTNPAWSSQTVEGTAQVTTTAVSAAANLQQQLVDNATKAEAVELAGPDSGQQPVLADPTLDATPETARQLMDMLSYYYGNSSTGKTSAEQYTALNDSKLQRADDNPLYGLSQSADSTMAMFADLMAAVLFMLRSSLDLKNNAVQNYCIANKNMAEEQRKEGVADMWGQVAGGVTSATISGIAAARTTYGSMKEIGAHGDQRLIDSNNAFAPDQAMVDTKMMQAKSHQAWGEWGQRGLSQMAGGVLSGGSALDKAGHTKKATESNASATISNMTADQQSQEVHGASAIVAKLLEQLSQYTSTQKQTISAIASNFRPV